MEVQQLKNDLAAVSGYTVTESRIRIVADYFQNYPSLGNEIYEMLRNEGYNDIGYFFSNLPLDRIKANGYNTGKMNAEIAFKNQTTEIESIVAATFVKGQVYSKQEVKGILQGIYDRLGLKKTAKATDLSNYIAWKIAKKDGLKAMRIT